MNLFSSSAFSTLRRIAIVFIAALTLMVTTACSQADTTASLDSDMPVPEASEAAVKRAQSNLSDQAIDEDVLSKQGESRARQTTSPVIAN